MCLDLFAVSVHLSVSLLVGVVKTNRVVAAWTAVVELDVMVPSVGKPLMAWLAALYSPTRTNLKSHTLI